MTRCSVRMLQHGFAGVLATVLCAATAAAQTPAPAAGSRAAVPGKAVSFGVLGGMTIANMTLPLDLLPSDLDPGLAGITFGSGRKAGFAGGFFVASPAQGRFAFETGALVSSKGPSLDVTVPGLGSANGSFRLIYLDLPFLARLEAARWSGGTLYILTGPSVDVNLSAKVNFAAAGQSGSEPLDGFPRMDYGWVAGGRVAMRRLLLELRYEHGLRNLAEDAPSSVKNRTVLAMAGVRF